MSHLGLLIGLFLGLICAARVANDLASLSYVAQA